MPKPYYNTVEINAEELAINIQRCKNQDTKIYELFKLFGKMTKWDVYDEYNNRIGSILDSSVGRSIKSLCDQGLITKTDELVRGDLGQLNTIYEISTEDVMMKVTRIKKQLVNSLKVNVIYNQLEYVTTTIDANAMFIDLNDKIVALLRRTGLQEHPIS